jgi:hypothetical protein
MIAQPLHLEAPVTLENEGANLYCPVEKELTKFFLAKSTDGMEVYVCGACNEPEPVIREVTQAVLEAVVKQIADNE